MNNVTAFHDTCAWYRVSPFHVNRKWNIRIYGETYMQFEYIGNALREAFRNRICNSNNLRVLLSCRKDGSIRVHREVGLIRRSGKWNPFVAWPTVRILDVHFN